MYPTFSFLHIQLLFDFLICFLILFCIPQLLVHNCNIDAPRLRPESQSYIDAYHRRHLVVLYAHHDLLVYGQFGGLPYRGANDNAHRKRRGSRGTKQNFVWNTGGRVHYDVFQGTYLYSDGRHKIYFCI